MSSIVTSILNLTFGLLWSKVRDHTANKLKEGDMTDEKCRQLIVRELDDIKTKLDGLARKDLLSSVSFLKEGFVLLNVSQDESTDGETSHPQEQKEDISQAEGSTMMGAGSSSVFNEACSLALSKEIRKLNIASGKRFASAMRSFEKSNTKATEAFSNEALTTEDRIMATKLRVISRILESLEDPDAAAYTCKLYLEELHCLPAVREMFSVQLEGGIKSRFYKTKRLENVMSVTVINVVLFNFIKKFTKMRFDLLHWPSIELGKQTYNPLVVLNEEILTKLEESGVQARNIICTLIATSKNINSYVSAVNSIGEIIASTTENNSDIMKITAGEVQLFCHLPPEDTEANDFKILSLAIDGEDNVYILTRCESIDKVGHFKLFVFDANGNIKHQSPLEFLDKQTAHSMYLRDPRIAVTKDKNVIILGLPFGLIHGCDNSGELKYSFRLEERDASILSISDENEIIVAQYYKKYVCIYTEEGNVKKTFEVPKDHGCVRDVTFNHVTKEIIVLTYDNHFTFYLLCYSKTGEKRQTIQSPFMGESLISHPSGPVALVSGEAVFYIQ